MKISSKLNELKPTDLNCNVFDVYSYDGLSMQELLCQFFTKINECIKVSNETIDLASWLVNEGLKIEVVKKLMLWLEDGTLENLINVNLFNTLHSKIENINLQLTHIAQQNVVDYIDLVENGDWSYAIQEAINNIENKGVVYLPQLCTIKKTIKVNKQISFVGNGHSKIICDFSNWGGHSFGDSIPQNTAIFIEGREPINNSHLADMNLNIGGFVLQCINSDDIETYGVYIGCNDISLMNQSSSINYAVLGKSFSNISLIGFDIGMEIGEVWDCTFTDIIMRNIKTNGFLLHGQSVNNFFKNCRIYGGEIALYVKGKTYPLKYSRPEGCIFEGGFYGDANIGVKHEDGLFCNYNNLVIDLNKQYAMDITSGDCVNVTNCYLYSNGDYTVKLNNMSSENNNISTSFIGNDFIGTQNNTYAIGDAGLWTGLIINGNKFSNYKKSGCIMLGYLNKTIVTNNIFKNNTINQCIVTTNTTVLSEFNNITNDDNVLVICRDGSVSTKVNTDININNFSILNDDVKLDLKNHNFNITIPSIENLKVNDSYFLNSIYSPDCNAVPIINCFIAVPSSASNSPGAANWIGEQIIFDTNFRCQKLYNTAGVKSMRFYSNGVWTEWKSWKQY